MHRCISGAYAPDIVNRVGRNQEDTGAALEGGSLAKRSRTLCRLWQLVRAPTSIATFVYGACLDLYVLGSVIVVSSQWAFYCL